MSEKDIINMTEPELQALKAKEARKKKALAEVEPVKAVKKPRKKMLADHSVLNRIDLVLYHSSLMSKIVEKKQGKPVNFQKWAEKVTEPFWDNIAPFGKWVKLQDKQNFESAVDALYKENKDEH